MSRSRIVVIVVGGGLLTGVAPAAAQMIEVGTGVARTQNPVKTLSDELCPAGKTWALEGRGALRFSRAVALEGVFGYHFENAGECTAEPVPPAPGTGPFERTVTGYPAAGYPYTTTDLRLAFEPSSPSGPMWLRAFGGYGRMWSKDIGYWLAGAGLVFGSQLTTVLDFEWNWFDEPFVTTMQNFMDGVLVGEASAPGERSRSTFRIKAGFRWPIR